MTRDELIHSVPIRQGAEGRIVQLSDIPQPWGQEFWIALAGHALARSGDREGPCARAEHWLRWVNGTPMEPLGPSDLEDSPRPPIL